MQRIQDTAISMASAAVDTQLPNYKVAATLTTLGGLAWYLDSRVLLLLDIAVGAGFFLNQHGVRNTVISARNTAVSVASTGSTFFSSAKNYLIPSAEVKIDEIAPKKTM